jgi:hypothetical protein
VEKYTYLSAAVRYSNAQTNYAKCNLIVQVRCQTRAHAWLFILHCGYVSLNMYTAVDTPPLPASSQMFVQDNTTSKWSVVHSEPITLSCQFLTGMRV